MKTQKPKTLWDTVKAVLRGKFIAIQAYTKKQEKSKINNLPLHLKQIEKEEIKIPRVSRRKEILKIRAGRGRERWQRNRTGRPLSPSQIPQKNISTPSKLHKTTSVVWQRTSGNQKSRPLSSKTGRKKYKRRERRQRRWGGSSVPGREAHPGEGILRREISKHQETLSLPSLW